MEEGVVNTSVTTTTDGIHIPISTNTWIEFKLPVAITLKMYIITTRDYADTITDGYSGSAPRDFDVEGRNSASDAWTKIDIRRDEKIRQNEAKTFHINDNIYETMYVKTFNEFRLYTHRTLGYNKRIHIVLWITIC